MKKIAILVHGFNVFNPERTVGKLKPFLEYEGFEVQMFRYGWMGLLGAWGRNIKLAERLAALMLDYQNKGYEVTVFTHSNGGTIMYLSNRHYDAKPYGVVCINPALKKTLHPCSGAEFVHVYYNGDDLPVKFGKWLRWLNPFARSARPWGEMGRVGYRPTIYTALGGVQNFDTENDFAVQALGHSGVFKEHSIDYFGPIIAVMSNPN